MTGSESKPESPYWNDFFLNFTWKPRSLFNGEGEEPSAYAGSDSILLENPLLFTADVTFGSCPVLDIMGFRNSGSNLEIDQRIIYPGDDGIVEPQGIKRWIAQQTIKAVAWALRNGGSLIDDIASQLGAKEAKYFTKHLDDIADVLDELAKQSQVLEQTIIDQIAGALYDLGVPLSTARTIANIFTFLAF